MSAPENNLRRLDAWLARQPVAASADFTSRTLQSIREDVARRGLDADARLDALLQMPAGGAGDDFTAATLQRVRATHNGHRILGMPAWLATVGGMAASLVIGIIAFAMLFDQARQVDVAFLGASPPLAPEVLATSRESSADAVPAAEVASMEDVFIMEMALEEIAGLREPETWQILAMLTE